jgi:hypothetical protein
VNNRHWLKMNRSPVVGSFAGPGLSAVLRAPTRQYTVLALRIAELMFPPAVSIESVLTGPVDVRTMRATVWVEPLVKFGVVES